MNEDNSAFKISASPVPNAVLELGLEENGVDRLTTAIAFYFDLKKATAWKYAVMLTAHSVELFLKMRLVRQYPSLIYRDGKGGFTVCCDEAIKRLSAIGVDLSPEEIAESTSFVRRATVLNTRNSPSNTSPPTSSIVRRPQLRS